MLIINLRQTEFDYIAVKYIINVKKAPVKIKAAKTENKALIYRDK